MAETASKMIALGTAAYDFRLPSTDGRIVELNDFATAPALLVMFICNHCPFVIHLRAALAQFGRDYEPRGLGMVAINSNDADTYPADGPAAMKQEVVRAGYTFPYLFDESQQVARAYGAACTPDFFLYDRERRLVYRGQFDDSRPGNRKEISGKDLRAAADAVLAGSPVPEPQRPSIGCNIKWKSR